VASALGGGSRDVLIGVRPEHLSFAETGIPAHVRIVESLGHERHIMCELGSSEQIIVRASSSAMIPGEGAPVHLDAAAEHVHRFDRASGKRMD
jgi:multiple sugar transport system ATP-binding protein